MRSLIICFVVFLSACNGSDKTVQIPYSDPALVAKINALTEALAAVTHEDAVKFSRLHIVGAPIKTSSSLKMQGEFRVSGVSIGVNFGTCTDMGTLVGWTSASGGVTDPESAVYQAWRQCTGYQYETALDGSVKMAPRIFWDGPNCTGNMYEWEASGAGYNTQTLKGGVVFTNPTGDGNTLMVQAGQTAQPIQMQSVWVSSNPGCQSDIETQNLYLVIANSVQVSGIPNSSVGPYSLSGLVN